MTKKATPKRATSKQELLVQIEELRSRLEKAQQALRAIQSGEAAASAEAERERLLAQAPEYAKQLRTANERLREQAEELRVAMEELSSQNDELRMARQQVEVERQRYQELFDFAPGGYLVTDQHGTVREVNHAAAEMLDVHADRLAGKPLAIYVAEQEHRTLYAQLARLQQARETFQWEMRLRPREGAPFPALVDVAPMRDAQGELVGLRWLLRDITERKRAEEAIASVAKFPSENPNPVLRLAPDGTVLYANEASDALLQAWGCAVGGDAPEIWRNQIAEALTSRLRKTVEVECAGRVYSFVVTPIPEAGYVNLYGRDITESKQAEAALRESEARYRALFEGMTEGFALHEIICDEQGQPCDYRFLEINPSFERLTGLKREDVIGKTHNEALPDDSSLWVQMYGQVALTGQTVHFDNYSPALQRHYEVFAYCPAPRQFAVLFLDVTERKQMEGTLRESEERLNRSQEIAHLGSWELDLRNNHLSWSDEVYRIFGLQPQGFGATYEVFLEAVHPDDRAAVDAAYSGSLREGRDSYEIEHRIIRKSDGEIRIVCEKCEHIRDASGRIIQSVGMVHDITDRKRAEQERERLHEENRQQWRLLETLFGADPDGLAVVVGEELVIRLANPAYRAFTLCPTENPVGQSWEQVWAGVVTPGTASAIRRVMVTGEPVDEESQQRVFPDGHVRYFSFHARKLLWNTEYAALTVIQETTAIEEARQEAQRRAAELDAIITSIADGVMIHDTASHIVRMNPAAERIMGYSPEERKLSFAERTTEVIQLTSSDGQRLIETKDLPVPRALRGEIVGSSVMRLHHSRTGKPLWVSVSAAPIQTPDGAMLGAVSTLADITELRQTQERLEQSNEQLQRQAEELEVQAEELQVTTQELIRARDESERHVQERTAELTLANAALQAEIVERQRAEAAVEAERQRFLNVLETLPAYLLLLSPDYHVPFANRFFRERFGESNGRRCFEYLFGRTEPCEVCETYKVLKTDAPLEWEWTGPDSRNYSVFDFPFTERDGSTFILEMGIDVTEQKRAQGALRLANAYNRSLIEASLDPLVTIGPDGKITDVNMATEHITGCPRAELIGTDFSDYFTEPEKARAGYQQVFREGVVRDYELAVRQRDGRATPVLYNASLYRDEAGQVVGVFAAARDITERMQTQQLLEQHVEERTRELSTLLATSHNLVSTLEPGLLLDLILDQLKCMVDYTGASILMRENEHLTLTDYRGTLSHDEALRVRLPVREAVGLREVIDRCEPVIIADLEGDSPLARAYRRSASEGQKRLVGGTRSWMGIPMIVKGQVIGVLRLSHEEPSYFTPRHAQLALAIANQAAVAIENARLYERAQQLAAMEERQRLARELHDSVSQALYGISLGAHTAIAMRDRDPAKMTEALDYILSLADVGLTEMRALIFELRPDSLETEGLTIALSKQMAAIQARHGVEVEGELCDEPDVPLKIKEAIYRIAQEALNNAVKHARANRLILRLDQDGESLTMEITDDGVGFDSTRSYPGHLGLRSMRERTAHLGGTLEIQSTPGQGTRICARFLI